ncbi:unnamed protein product [Paramecium octaurelia]|uniref:Uncharacterized protein n=1 Tax=Paramecium octaurelia TaxID=43137 RepID=A0A8S1W5E7_PAROT|nr:unnamed protein product [Paramecium octaurelia]
MQSDTVDPEQAYLHYPDDAVGSTQKVVEVQLCLVELPQEQLASNAEAQFTVKETQVSLQHYLVESQQDLLELPHIQSDTVDTEQAYLHDPDVAAMSTQYVELRHSTQSVPHKHEFEFKFQEHFYLHTPVEADTSLHTSDEPQVTKVDVPHMQFDFFEEEQAVVQHFESTHSYGEMQSDQLLNKVAQQAPLYAQHPKQLEQIEVLNAPQFIHQLLVERPHPVEMHEEIGTLEHFVQAELYHPHIFLQSAQSQSEHQQHPPSDHQAQPVSASQTAKSVESQTADAFCNVKKRRTKEIIKCQQNFILLYCKMLTEDLRYDLI